MNWLYFTLEPDPHKPGLYQIVDEEGCPLLDRSGDPILVVDEEEAEDTLEDERIRGSVR